MPARRPIIGNYLFFFFAMGGAFPYLAPYFKEMLHVSNQLLGVLLMIRPAVALLAQPFWSYAADVRGKRSHIVFSLALAAAALFPLLLVSRSMPLLISILVVWSFFYTPINSLSDSIAFDYLGHKRRMHFSGLRIFASLGFLLGVTGLGYVYQSAGLAWLFPVFSSGMVAAAWFLWRLPQHPHPPSTRTREAFRHLFQNRNVLFFLGAVLLTETANQMGYLFLSVYARSLGASHIQVGWLWAVGTGSEMVMMLFMPKLIGRFGVQKILLAGMTTVALRWALFAFVHAWWQLFPVQLIQVFTVPFIYVGSVTFMDMESSSDIRFTAQAFYSTFVIHGGMIVGSLVGGKISQHSGYAVLYTIGGGLAVLAGLILVLFVREPAAHTPSRQLF